jgi:NAD(P)-dependent dehydrogenase (short-subunit alcohol dehydrogenase family)
MKQVIVISGGSDGLGRAIAEYLTSENQVVILSPNEDKLTSVATHIGCAYEVCDIADHQQVVGAIGNIIKRYGRIDCLINNAALWIQGPLETNDPAAIDRIVNVNVTGAIHLTHTVIPQMKQQQAGRIINIISQAGFYAKAERSIYTATKFAMTGFTKSLQPELAPFGIGVTGLYPGKLKTEMFHKLGIAKDMSDALSPEEVAKTVAFILSLDPTTVFPEVGIKHIDN